MQTITPLACAHPVCLECVSARPEILARCAQCSFTTQSSSVSRSKRTVPCTAAQQQVGWAPDRTDGEQSKVEVAGVHPKIDVEEIACQVCGSGDDDAMMVLCDDCPRGYHTYCLSPPLEQIPSGDWFCPRCAQQREESKRRAKDRAAEYWCNKRRATGNTADSRTAATSSGTSPASRTDPSSPQMAVPSPAQAQPSPSTIDALRSGFVEYCRQMQLSIERAQPHLSRSAVLAKLGSEWRVLSDAHRQKYAALAAKAKQQQRLSAVAAEVSGAMGASVVAVPGAATSSSSTSTGGGTVPHSSVIIPMFVRATRHVMEGSKYWLSLSPTGEGRLKVEWRIPEAATCVIVALGWAQGRPAYVERTDTSSVLQREGAIHFTEAHIARFAGFGSDKSDQEGAASVTIKEARPLVMRLWLDASFGDHGAPRNTCLHS